MPKGIWDESKARGEIAEKKPNYGKVIETAEKPKGKRTFYVKPRVEQMLQDLTDALRISRSQVLEKGIFEVWKQWSKQKDELKKKEQEQSESEIRQTERRYMKKILSPEHTEGWEEQS